MEIKEEEQRDSSMDKSFVKLLEDGESAEVTSYAYIDNMSREMYSIYVRSVNGLRVRFPDIYEGISIVTGQPKATGEHTVRELVNMEIYGVYGEKKTIYKFPLDKQA